MSTEGPSDRIVIAAVARPHGLKGALRVKVFNPATTALAPGAKVTVTLAGGTSREMHVRTAQSGKDVWLVVLDECQSIEAAEALRGAEISVRRDELPPADEGEFYHADLVGCAVVDPAGVAYGTVRDVVSYPSVDALLVNKTDGSEVEVPFVDGIVIGVDMTSRVVKIEPALLETD